MIYVVIFELAPEEIHQGFYFNKVLDTLQTLIIFKIKIV